ncbi:MAG TPA: DUF4870 domain-containing protein [Gemmataceae bacterium]|jgi:uncharacterized Tic20 family protein|nr:DUF4870 domain-containing protein [Gemmataceae bacterium]
MNDEHVRPLPEELPPEKPHYDEALPAEERTSALSIPSNSEERQMGLFCHLGGALLGFLVPLIIWVMKKDTSKFLDDQGKEALNFQLTLLIGHFVAGLTICFTFGSLNGTLWLLGLIFGIMGGQAANKGEVYRYPINIRMIT